MLQLPLYDMLVTLCRAGQDHACTGPQEYPEVLRMVSWLHRLLQRQCRVHHTERQFDIVTCYTLGHLYSNSHCSPRRCLHTHHAAMQPGIQLLGV
jgi:hypothetical protein